MFWADVVVTLQQVDGLELTSREPEPTLRLAHRASFATLAFPQYESLCSEATLQSRGGTYWETVHYLFYSPNINLSRERTDSHQCG